MKIRYLTFVLIFFLILFSSFIGISSYRELTMPKTLSIYAPENFIPDYLVKEFYESSRIKIEVTTYVNEVDFFEEIESGASYDLILCNDYLTYNLKEQEKLKKINKIKLKNYKYLDSTYLNNEFDLKNKYSVPYLFGTIGIYINTDKFQLQGPLSWIILCDPLYLGNTSILDSPYELMSMMSLISLGKTFPENENDFLILKNFILNKTYLPQKIPYSELGKYLENNSLIFAGGRNGYLSEKTEFVIPKEGGIRWLQSFVIPKNSKNVLGSYIFIDYVLEPKTQASIANTYNLGSPNKKSLDYILSSNLENQEIYPLQSDFDRLRYSEHLHNQSLEEKYEEIIMILSN
ncbi:extracellular solute-binding protein [archaeon]|nr:extracellular solute-binding protein [archaeon]